MLCNHDDETCEVCTSCRLCFPHTVGYRDGEALQGGCREADLQRRLGELDVLERGERRFSLAAFAIVTAWYAGRAFLKLSREVAAIERQVSDARTGRN